MTVPEKPYFQTIAEEVIDLAGDYVRGGGLRVSVKTNLGPELPVYNGGSSGGLIDLLGIKAGVIVRGKDGGVIASYGDPPPTEPIKVVLLALVVGLIGIALIRGVLPR